MRKRDYFLPRGGAESFCARELDARRLSRRREAKVTGLLSRTTPPNSHLALYNA